MRGRTFPLLPLVAPLLVLLLGASHYVYPAMVGGDYRFRIQAVVPLDADGVPTNPIPGSLGIVSVTDGTRVGCINVGDWTVPHEIIVSISVTGSRELFQGYAYLEQGCGGLVSDPSAQTALTWPGMAPRPPDLVAWLLRWLG